MDKTYFQYLVGLFNLLNTPNIQKFDWAALEQSVLAFFYNWLWLWLFPQLFPFFKFKNQRMIIYNLLL